jgi:hypothetical protein
MSHACTLAVISRWRGYVGGLFDFVPINLSCIGNSTSNGDLLSVGAG